MEITHDPGLELRLLHLEIKLRETPPELVAFLKDAYEDREGIGWEWFRDSDGCTGVDERHWPSRFFPPCVAHDYACVLAASALSRREADWIRARADLLFFRANRHFGVDLFLPPPHFRNSCVGRYVGVRLYWWLVGRWRVPRA